MERLFFSVESFRGAILIFFERFENVQFDVTWQLSMGIILLIIAAFMGAVLLVPAAVTFSLLGRNIHRFYKWYRIEMGMDGIPCKWCDYPNKVDVQECRRCLQDPQPELWISFQGCGPAWVMDRVLAEHLRDNQPEDAVHEYVPPDSGDSTDTISDSPLSFIPMSDIRCHSFITH